MILHVNRGDGTDAPITSIVGIYNNEDGREEYKIIFRPIDGRLRVIERYHKGEPCSDVPEHILDPMMYLAIKRWHASERGRKKKARRDANQLKLFRT